MKVEADLGALAPILEKLVANQEAALKFEAEAVTSILKSVNDGVSMCKTFMDREFARQDKRDADNAVLNAAERKLKTLELQLRITELSKKFAADEKIEANMEKIAELKARAALDEAEAEAVEAANKLKEEKDKAEILEAKKAEALKRIPKMDDYELNLH